MLMNQWNNIEKSDTLYTVKEYALTIFSMIKVWIHE